MHPSDHPTAWEHPPTRRAWTRQTTISILAFIGWFISPWCLVFVLVGFLPTVFVAAFALPICYSAYRACIQPLVISFDFRIRTLLRTYPWRLDDTPYSLSAHPKSSFTKPWFEFPHPGRTGERIPMFLHLHYRTGFWDRRMAPRAKPQLKAQLSPIWFAGDPRFFGVMAVTRPGSDKAGPVPRRLHLLVQIGPSKREAPIDVNPWQAAPEDLARARQAVGWRGPCD